MQDLVELNFVDWHLERFNLYNLEKAKCIELVKGDFIKTPPYEIHALKIGKEGNQFVVFTEGKRGGIDYEKDTYRVPSIIE